LHDRILACSRGSTGKNGLLDLVEQLIFALASQGREQ
jgi:hypothetical protein